MRTLAPWRAWIGSAGAVALALTGCGGGGAAGTAPPAVCTSTATLVCTKLGQVQGTVEAGQRVFRGIPFAAPPVGNLRWRPPAAPNGWTGVRSATTFGHKCPQFDLTGALAGDEDCLTLNIYAINPPASTKQPVMVYIHGGGERTGSAQDPPWDVPPPLVNHGVIVVTVEYRLGVLGWLTNPLLTAEGQGSSGNYGLMDAIAALHWVHDNIAEFGGDPDKVTIFGESAGGENIYALLASPAAAGLFWAAAMESSYAIKGGLIGTSVDYSYPWYAALPGIVNCDTAADVLACLRAVPAAALVQTSVNANGTGWINIEPVVVPEDPLAKLTRLGTPVPVLIGTNSDELAYLYVLGPALDPVGYAASIHTQFDAMASGAGDTILSLYPAANYTNANYALNAVETDADYTCNTRNFARAVSGAGRPAVWRYLFTHAYENDPSLNAVRAFHVAELAFVSGNFTTGVIVTSNYSPSAAETALSEQMMGYWARFAATGDPNGSGAAAQWLPYDSGENTLQLDDTIMNLAGGYRNTQCDFLSTLPIIY